MHRKLLEAVQNKSYHIILKNSDIEDLPLNNDDLPVTMSAMIEIYKSAIFMNNASGGSGLNLLGRFCHGDATIMKMAEKIRTIEDNVYKDAILAEIVHVPEARTGNILQRPHLSHFEIPYLGHSSLNITQQIPITDLFVSIKNDRIVLRSKKWNREIIPRLSNAHNYGNNTLPMYQFLCDLQSQNMRSSIGFQWNHILKSQEFLPRVTFENTIFSKACWHVKTSIFKKLMEDFPNNKALDNWRNSLQIPDYVELVDGDNKLLVYLKNKNSCRLLLETVKNIDSFILEEFLFHKENLVKNLNDESYCNQIVVAFHKDQYLKG